MFGPCPCQERGRSTSCWMPYRSCWMPRAHRLTSRPSTRLCTDFAAPGKPCEWTSSSLTMRSVTCCFGWPSRHALNRNSARWSKGSKGSRFEVLALLSSVFAGQISDPIMANELGISPILIAPAHGAGFHGLAAGADGVASLATIAWRSWRCFVFGHFLILMHMRKQVESL